jgi:hypothetical protein
MGFGTHAETQNLTSTSMPDETYLMVDPSKVAVAMDAPEVRVARNATVELADSSSQSSVDTVTAAEQTSMFQTNSSAILGEMYANWRVITPDAVKLFSAQSF